MPKSGTPALPIALTMGEPGGIAGEITVKAWRSLHTDGRAPFFVIADPAYIESEAGHLGETTPIAVISRPSEAAEVFSRALPVLDPGLRVSVRPGVADTANAEAVIASIRTAVELCLSQAAAATVTNPINKSSLYDAGFTFPGHTEFIADLCAVETPVMMLASPTLRVVPVTVHQSLASAIGDLTSDRIVAIAEATARALQRDFGITTPRLAVAGLNPHAGEGGALGTEESAVIQPAIERLRTKGLDVAGPVPPDALFTPHYRGTYDAAVCMYHDQALIPIKALDFDRAVNTTLGLPIVRTSPDHGTALDIAGKGIASPSSLIAAIGLAAEMAASRSAAGSPE